MTTSLLADSAGKLFEAEVSDAEVRAGMRGEWLGGAWAAIEVAGLPLAMVDEAHGGFGVEMAEALELVRLAAARAVPLPLGEAMLAERALAAAGLAPAAGAASFAVAEAFELAAEQGGWRLRSELRRVPWGRHVQVLAVQIGERIARVEAGGWRLVEAGANGAGHPRDRLRLDVRLPASAVAPGDTGLGLAEAASALRAVQIAGALDRALELTVAYVSERAQFGRPLSKFQVVQQELARAAGQVAAAAAAAGFAADALAGRLQDPETAIAVARVRSGEAVGVVAAVAHQLHGAIGFTEEHRLQTLTRPAWAWRDEDGGHLSYARRLGAAALAAGGDGLWPLVTRIGAAA